MDAILQNFDALRNSNTRIRRVVVRSLPLRAEAAEANLESKPLIAALQDDTRHFGGDLLGQWKGLKIPIEAVGILGQQSRDELVRLQIAVT